MKAWLGLAVTLVLSGAGALWHLSGQTADTKRRVDQLEERTKEDRREARAEQREIKADVKEVKSEVQQIRILLEGMKRSGR